MVNDLEQFILPFLCRLREICLDKERYRKSNCFDNGLEGGLRYVLLGIACAREAGAVERCTMEVDPMYT